MIRPWNSPPKSSPNERRALGHRDEGVLERGWNGAGSSSGNTSRQAICAWSRVRPERRSRGVRVRPRRHDGAVRTATRGILQAVRAARDFSVTDRNSARSGFAMPAGAGYTSAAARGYYTKSIGVAAAHAWSGVGHRFPFEWNRIFMGLGFSALAVLGMELTNAVYAVEKPEQPGSVVAALRPRGAAPKRAVKLLPPLCRTSERCWRQRMSQAGRGLRQMHPVPHRREGRSQQDDAYLNLYGVVGNHHAHLGDALRLLGSHEGAVRRDVGLCPPVSRP